MGLAFGVPLRSLMESRVLRRYPFGISLVRAAYTPLVIDLSISRPIRIAIRIIWTLFHLYQLFVCGKQERYFSRMISSKPKSEPQIAPLVVRNLSSLQSLIVHLDSTKQPNSIVGSHLARFKLWSATLGAHRSSGSRALEYRLRDASSVRDQVLSLLGELASAADQGKK